MWSNSTAFMLAHQDILRQSLQIRGYMSSNLSNTPNVINSFISNASIFASNTSFWASNVVNEWMLACAFMGDLAPQNTIESENPNSKYQKSGSSLITTDTYGEGVIQYDEPFDTAFTSAIVCNGDPNLTLVQIFTNSNCSLSNIGISLCPNPGVVDVRVNWISTGF